MVDGTSICLGNKKYTDFTNVIVYKKLNEKKISFSEIDTLLFGGWSLTNIAASFVARALLFSIPAFPLRSLPLTAQASCLIRYQLLLRRLYFNWVDLTPFVLLVGRPAQATQFFLLTLCFAPTMLLVRYPAGFEQPHFLLLCFLPPMLPVWHPRSPSVFWAVCCWVSSKGISSGLARDHKSIGSFVNSTSLLL